VKTVKKLLAGSLVVVSLFVGAGMASASSSVVNSEKSFITSQVKSQLLVGLKWKACSNGQCANTDGDSLEGSRLIVGAYPNGMTLEITGITANGDTLASMESAVQRITVHYVGRKPIQWLSGLSNKSIDATKTFGRWSVRAIANSSHHGENELELTRAS
jgi:hypothetical protein